jgi:DNA-binding winged helix-turn-helix (wHTH) protein/TolB-like protein
METERVYRFGVFEFDPDRLDLRRDERSVRLQRQPAQVLALLLARAGQLVTRDELRLAIWGSETFVDFDRGLNFCIAQVRTALGDDAGTPRYVRTVPKKGYEFIGPVETRARLVPAAQPSPAPRVEPGYGRRRVVAIAAAAALAAIAVLAFYRMAMPAERPIVAVARFDNETGNPDLTRFSDYLTDSLVEQLTAENGSRYRVVGNAAILRSGRDARDLLAIGASLHAEYVVLGQVQRDRDHVRVLGHLIHLPDQTHLTVARFDDVSEQTLANTSDIARRMADKFARRLPARRFQPASR